MKCVVNIIQATKVMEKEMVLSNINMSMESGKIYGLVGKNGSGKSMLIRALSGMIQLTEGTIEFHDGEEQKKNVWENHMGVMIENEEMYGEFTGYQNLKFLADINKKIGEKEIKLAMERVGLCGDSDKKYKKYSLGMRQKLAIAQAIMEKPKYLFLDEPTNGLDEDSIQLFYQLIREEQKRGAVILLASHSKEDIQELCDEVYYMKKGTLEKEK